MTTIPNDLLRQLHLTPEDVDRQDRIAQAIELAEVAAACRAIRDRGPARRWLQDNKAPLTFGIRAEIRLALDWLTALDEAIQDLHAIRNRRTGQPEQRPEITVTAFNIDIDEPF